MVLDEEAMFSGQHLVDTSALLIPLANSQSSLAPLTNSAITFVTSMDGVLEFHCANATKVEVELKSEGGSAMMRVQDNGGFRLPTWLHLLLFLPILWL